MLKRTCAVLKKPKKWGEGRGRSIIHGLFALCRKLKGGKGEGEEKVWLVLGHKSTKCGGGTFFSFSYFRYGKGRQVYNIARSGQQQRCSFGFGELGGGGGQKASI